MLIKSIETMKTLKKSSGFYQKVLEHFRKQYSDVKEITLLKITADNQICGGEWIDSKGQIFVANSLDAVRSAKIID